MREHSEFLWPSPLSHPHCYAPNTFRSHLMRTFPCLVATKSPIIFSQLFCWLPLTLVQERIEPHSYHKGFSQRSVYVLQSFLSEQFFIQGQPHQCISAWHNTHAYDKLSPHTDLSLHHIWTSYEQVSMSAISSESHGSHLYLQLNPSPYFSSILSAVQFNEATRQIQLFFI